MATMSLPVVEGHNGSELFKKVLIIAARILLDKIQYWYVYWSLCYGYRWKRAFQYSIMSTVPLKVSLMGFNLLLWARGNILMRKKLHTILLIPFAPVNATGPLPVQYYGSPLLSFATLHVIQSLVWLSSWCALARMQMHPSSLSYFKSTSSIF